MEENEIKEEQGLALYHPLVSFGYFAAVIAGALLFVHPVFGLISLICAIIYSSKLNNAKNQKFILAIGVPMMFFIAIVNPLFTHRGVTVLFYLGNNPITLEATVYGIVSAIMMFSTVMWFACYNKVVTSDKFLYIFGKILPSIALVISMTLSLIPRLLKQVKIISESQKCMGLDWKSGPLKMRLRSASRILSVLVSWALEDAVTTADSMSARGYGIVKRSSFSIFRFGQRDLKMLVFLAVLFALEIITYITGRGTMSFYPFIEYKAPDLIDTLLYISYLALGIMPSILAAKEDRKWKLLK